MGPWPWKHTNYGAEIQDHEIDKNFGTDVVEENVRIK